jgi:hypothetical protein
VGRVLVLAFIYLHAEITLVNIYGPNEDDISLFLKIQSNMESKQNKTFIFG